MGNKKKANIQKLILLTILVLAFFLRFYKLGQVPPSLNWDEAAIGYNAYSLLKTGRDEYGVSFPLVFRSFGDYKPPLYVYLTIPSVAIFGLNELAVRFPSALFGTLTVLVIYCLANELFVVAQLAASKNVHQGGPLQSAVTNSSTPGESKPTPGVFLGDSSVICSLLSVFLLAISPWHIQFSRGAFEANLGLFLAVLGTYLFLKSLANKVFLPLSAAVFSVCLYAYHSSRVFIPLLLFSLALLYRKELFKAKKWLILSVLIGLIIALPLIKLFTQGQILTRFSGVSAFADPSLLERSIKKIEEDNNSLLAKIIHNRRWVYSSIFLKNYLSHFDPNFLFVQADKNPRHHAPGNGLLYFWEMITIPLGFYFLFHFKDKKKWLILAFLFLAPIAAAPAKAAPHAIRFLNSLPGWTMISSFGLVFLFKKKKMLGFLLAIFILSNLIYWANLYFIHLPLETSQAWQYGYKQAVNEVAKIEKDYNQVLVTGQYDQPYIFFLFYQQYNPQKYQNEYGNPEDLPRYARSFGRYQFIERINLARIEEKDKLLIVGAPEELGGKADFKLIKEINFLDGSPAFLIGEKI